MSKTNRTRDKPFKAAAVDIDGTLKGGKTVSAENIAAVDKLKKAGLMVLPATGRIRQQTVPFYRLAKLNGPLVMSDGALVHSASGKLMMKTKIGRNLATAVRNLGNICDVTTISHLNQGVCVSRKSFWNEMMALHQEELGERVMFKDASELHRLETFFIIQSAPKDALDEVEALAREQFLPSDMRITRYNSEQLHFKAPGVDKVHGLSAVCRLWDLEPSQIICFGDSRNDVEMLEWAGLGVAMDHGTDLAKAHADVVASSPSADVDFAAGVEAVLALI